MQVSRELKIGKALYNVTEPVEGLEELIDKFSVLDDLPETCGNCESESLKLQSRTVTKDKKTVTYREVVCADCGHVFKFGTLQAGGLYPKGWHPPYQGSN